MNGVVALIQPTYLSYRFGTTWKPDPFLFVIFSKPVDKLSKEGMIERCAGVCQQFHPIECEILCENSKASNNQ